MPEIAECYSIAKQIRTLTPNSVKKVSFTPKFNTYLGDTDKVGQLVNMSIKDIFAYGKSIWFELDGEDQHGYMVSQLGMTGAWFIDRCYNRNDKHNHLVIDLANGQKLIYSDPRMFGNIHYYVVSKKESLTELKKSIIKNHKWGLDPLQSSASEMIEAMKRWNKSSKSIKDLMLNQNVVFGIGNYLAAEVLAMSSISPYRDGSKLSAVDIKHLHKNLLIVIKKALKYNGYSFAKGYYLPDGSLGQFTDVVKVYEHAGDICPYCKKGRIKKEFISGRSTYYCSKCQR
jgi:formamidopyrimidine-DNA glycosylase